MHSQSISQRKRDRSKAQKWMKMVANDGIPGHIAALFKDVPKGITKTKHQTEVINSCFKRKGTALQMNLKNPRFEQYKETHNRKTVDAAAEAMPDILFKGKFNLTDERFAEGLRTGQILEKQVGQEIWYVARSITCTRSQGKNEGSRMRGDQLKLKPGESDLIDNAFGNMDFSSGARQFSGTLPSSSSSSAANPALALGDWQRPALSDKIWQDMQGVIYEGKAAYATMHRQAMGILKNFDSPQMQALDHYGNLSLAFYLYLYIYLYLYLCLRELLRELFRELLHIFCRKNLVKDMNDMTSQLDHMLTWKAGQGRGIVISQMAILTNYEICQQL